MKVKVGLNETAKMIDYLIDKQGAIPNAIPYISASTGYYTHISKYRKLLDETFSAHNIKKISLERAIKISFKNHKNQEIAVTGSAHLKPFTTIYYRNHKGLNSFINNTFKEDRVVRYFKLNK